MGKIMHNGVEYGGGGYSKKQTDDKLRLKLDKSAVESMLSDSSANPVQNKVVTTELKGKVPQVKTMPISAEDGFAVLYTGTNTATYTLGHIYQYNENDDLWVDITASGGSETIQVEILPTASVSELGNIYQYVGATTATYTNGYFYECVEDSGAYGWVEKEVQKNDDVPHWSGTRAEYEAIKDTLEAGTYVSITDDYDEGLEVVDEVEENNMNVVTSNAVYKALSKIGNNYTSTVAEHTGSAWVTKSVTVSNLPKGKYLVFGKIMTDTGGSVKIAILTYGWGSVTFSQATGDFAGNTGLLDVYNHASDGTANFTIQIYLNPAGGKATAQLMLIRMA